MYCSQCGKEIVGVRDNCQNCGWKVGNAVQTQGPAANTWTSPYDAPVRSPYAGAGSTSSDATMRMLLPIDRSAFAIIAGYLGLFSVLILPAPLAILFALLAFRDMKRNPKLGGKGRAIFGLVMGILCSLPLVLLVLASLAR